MDLHTVCEEARCPNLNDCWSRGTATFMVAGKECTRGCRFCSVETLRNPEPPDPNEPEELAAAVERMRLEHVVITVVNRDDLADGGASHYKRCVQVVHDRLPHVTIELLVQRFGAAMMLRCESLLDDIPLAVFAHNVECVPRLDRQVRDPRASFAQSLRVLRRAKELRPDLCTKSSIMIGLGETDDEVIDAMAAAAKCRCRYVDAGPISGPRHARASGICRWIGSCRRSNSTAWAEKPERSVFEPWPPDRSCGVRTVRAYCWARPRGILSDIRSEIPSGSAGPR